MEYVIGFWLIGVVFTSLFIVGSLVAQKRKTLAGMNGLEMIGMTILTSLVWPAFWGYSIYYQWKNWKDWKAL